MGYAYDTKFKVGFTVTVVVFVLINFVSFMLAGLEYDRLAETNKFFPVEGRLPWGFPLHWSGGDFSSFLANLFVRPIANIVVILGLGLVGGFVARFLGLRQVRK